MIQDMLRQTRNALIYADLALFLLDTRSGITYNDVALYKWLTQAVDKQTLIKPLDKEQNQREKKEKPVAEAIQPDQDYLKMFENQVQNESLDE